MSTYQWHKAYKKARIFLTKYNCKGWRLVYDNKINLIK